MPQRHPLATVAMCVLSTNTRMEPMPSAEPRAYFANENCYSEPGKIALHQHVIPRIQELGVQVAEPFKEGEDAKAFDIDHYNSLKSYDARMTYMRIFNRKIYEADLHHIDRSDLVLAMLDGVPLDPGVADEIRRFERNKMIELLMLHYENRSAEEIERTKRKTVIGWRTDLRPSENIASPVTIMTYGAIEDAGGRLVEGSLSDFIAAIAEWRLNYEPYLEAALRVQKERTEPDRIKPEIAALLSATQRDEWKMRRS